MNYAMKNKKSVFQCSVYMGEEGVNIYSTEAYVVKLLRLGNFIPFVPEWRVEEREAKNAPFLECIFSDQSTSGVYETGDFFISGRFEELAESNTIPYFIHYILESERAKRGKTTIHAASVSKNGKGILILGKQGSGKTSVALELCRKHGYSLIGNDLVLAGIKGSSGYLYGGTKIFRLRATTIKDYNQDLERFFKSRENNDEWTHITIVKPEEIQVTLEKSIVPIHAIYYIHLYPPNHDLITEEVDRFFSRIYLYQAFSEYIRGSAIIPLIGKDLKFGNYLPSLDNENAFKKRIEFITWIINNENYRYVAGSLPDICAFIDQNL